MPLKNKTLQQPPDPKARSLSPTEERPPLNLSSILPTSAYFLGDRLQNYYPIWHFEGELERYNRTEAPAVSFFNELHCLMEETTVPPSKLEILNIEPLDFSLPDPGILDKTMLYCFLSLGQSQIPTICLEGFTIPEAAFIEWTESLRRKARSTEGSCLKVLSLRYMHFTARQTDCLVNLIRDVKTLESIDLTGTTLTLDTN